MEINRKKMKLVSALLLSLPFTYHPIVEAAKPINLRYQNLSALQGVASSNIAMTEMNRAVDFKHTLHIRVQETYLGYPVWGADAVIHVPNNKKSTMSLLAMMSTNNTSMNGIVYQDIHQDLAKTSPSLLTEAQAQKALQQTINHYQHQTGNNHPVSEQESKLLVFIGKDNKAHWAYKVSFLQESNKTNEKPVRLVSIVDAMTMQTYVTWDDIKTLESVEADGGGFGGNVKMGKLVYDGLPANLAKLTMLRDETSKTCFLRNAEVVVKDRSAGYKVMNFTCENANSDHNNVYWSADFDTVNEGYSPGNDALFGGQVIKHMYKDWYGIPVLVNRDGTPMLLEMVVHLRNYDNAYWDGSRMSFGDGFYMFYPLTSLGVAAHEISHGFTEQHSGLIYYGQSGGLNESFSDMAAQAAEMYAYGPGKNSWQIGPEIFKAKDKALRYMDKPSKDCRPGARQCSIDDASQYRDGLDVHYSSGVYNRFFYTLGTTENWDAKKAFDVMVHANSHYWTSGVSFKEAACGVLSAAKDLNHDLDAVKAALDVVKIDHSDCKLG